MYTWEIPREKPILRGGLEFRLKYHLQLKKKKKSVGVGKASYEK